MAIFYDLNLSFSYYNSYFFLNCFSTEFLSSPLAGKRDIVVTILIWCSCVRVSVQICPDHNLCNNAWISKQFGTVVALRRRSAI